MAEENKEEIKETFVPKEIGELFGLEDQVSVNDFKEKLSSEWIKRDNIYKDDKLKSELHGWVFGSTSNDLKKKARDIAGVELSKDEISSNRVEDLFDITLNKTKQKYESELSSLREQLSTGDGSKVYEDKISQLTGELESTKSLLESSRSKFEEERKQIETENYNRDLNAYKSTLTSHIPFSSDVDELKKMGYDSWMKDNTQLSKDSNGNWEILNKEGKRIEHPTKIGDWIRPDEYYKMKADEFGLTKLNTNQATSKDYKPEVAKVETKTPENTSGFKLHRRPVGLG